MKRMIIFLSFLVTLSICVSAYLFIQKTGWIKQSPIAEHKAERLRKAIRAEIDSLPDHEWAGEYYYGDGLGVNVSLLLAPRSGCLFEWHGCLGLYDRNYGDVEFKDGIIHLSLTLPNKQKGFRGIAEDFILISWDKRKYLIPANDLITFCNDINSGSEPRQSMHGMHLLKCGDEQKTADGTPQIPEEYKKYLLKNPINAEILAVGNVIKYPGISGCIFKKTAVTLNAGKQEGTLPGMEFHIISPDTLTESVIIQKVSDHQSEGVMTQTDEDADEPQIGWKLSTDSK